MSTLQLNERVTSAEPRLVMERTSSNPGTPLTACSMGRVMVTSICSIGMTPFSTPTMIRGKLVVGKTATGIPIAAYTPAMPRIKIRKTMDFECRANQ